MEVLDEESERNVHQVRDDEHFSGVVLSNFEEVENNANDKETFERQNKLGADVFPVTTPKYAAVGVRKQGKHEVYRNEQCEKPLPGG